MYNVHLGHGDLQHYLADIQNIVHVYVLYCVCIYTHMLWI